MDAATYSRVMALLEEAKEELESAVAGNGFGLIVDYPALRARVDGKITQAQDLMMGQRPMNPEDN